MSNFGSAVAWLVLAPFALTTNVVAVVVVCHYRRQFHGSDAALISLFVTMTLHAVVALPVAAGVELGGSGWPPELCSFYVWLLVCVRMSQLLTTGVMNVHWMCILRFTSGQEVYSSAIVVKVLVCLAWFGGVVTGLVPVVGFGVYSYFQQFSDGGGGRGECSFLPQGLSTSFVVFFFIVTLATMILSLVSSADTLAVFKYMRRTAVEKYKAGRFYLPSSSNVFSTSTSANGHDNARVRNSTGWHSDGGIDGQTIAIDEEEEIKQGGSPFVTSNGRIANGKEHSHGLSAQTTAGGIYGRGTVLGRGPGEKNGQVAANSAAAIVVRPSGKSGVARSNPATVHAKYNELNLSSELCRVVVCFTLLTALIQHLPFAVLQFIQLVQPVDRVAAQVVVLWLLLLEALTAPHVLWVLSRRYRHALVYVWTVHVLRDTSAKEEDPSACTLQSYTRRVHAPDGATVRVTARVRRGMTITSPVPEYQPNGRVGGNLREDDRDGFCPDYTGAARRGAEIITTDLDDDLTVITDLASTKKRYIYHSPASERAAQASLQRPEAAEGSGGSSQTTSPSRLSVNSPTRPFDMRRSGSAREAWKEQMRKKHLPAVFVNDAFDAEEEAERGQDLVSDMDVLPDVALVGDDFDEVDSEDENVGGNGVANETLRKTSERRPTHHVINHYFHHDYQRSDGAPRVESESDGSSFQYDDRDIEIILDGHHGLHSGGSRSLLEKVVEAEALRETNDDPVPHFAATTEDVSKDGYLGRVDSCGDSSEGSSTEKQSIRGRKKPPRRSSLISSRTNRGKDQQRFVLEGENDLDDRSDATEEARAWTSQGEGLKQGADEFVGRELLLYEADQSKQMPAYESQKDFNQYSSSVDSDKDGFRTNFSRLPESVNSGLVSVAFSKNDFIKLQNITSDATDADNIPDNVSIISTAFNLSGDKNSFNKANKVLVKDIFKDEFDEVAPQNPRKRTEVMDKDFDDVDEPRGTPTGNIVINTPWAAYTGGGNIKNGSYPSGRVRSSYFRRDVDSGKQMITMVDSDADLPDTAIVLDVLETSSSGSEHSVVLEPYYRRPLWLDEDDEQSPRNNADDLLLSNPFRVSSGGHPFADPSREVQRSHGLSSGLEDSFGGNLDIKGKRSYDLINPFQNEAMETTSSSGAYSHDTFSSESDTAQSSGSSDQLSFLRDATSERLGTNNFDDEADRFHDNTIAIDYNIMVHPYYGSYPGLYFESIKEEPEDLSDSTLSDHTEDEALGSMHGTLRSFSAESFGPSKTKPFLLDGDSTFQIQAGLPVSQTVNKDVAPPGRTSADGREAPTPDVCSAQRTGTLEPEDLPYWDVGAVSISMKQPSPSFQLLKASPMMDHKVNGIKNFSNDLRANLDLPRTANGDAPGALTDVKDDSLPRRKPPPPPRRSSISNDGPLIDSELQTHPSEASHIDPVYF